MNVKVITRHAPSNYGSLLQSLATMIVVKRLGHECQIIDYIRDDERGLKSILNSLKRKKEWNHNLFKKFFYILSRYTGEYYAQCKFDHMRERYLELTDRCNSIEGLLALEADIFMTGSDQVWGPVANGNYDEVYFLSFVENKMKKIAYAASFGKTDFTSQIISDYKKLLSNYRAIAVRENTAVDLLDKIGEPCMGQVLDPTLLLTGNEWSQYIGKEIQGKYVLVYQLHNNIFFNDYAKRFAKKTGLPLIRISPSLHQFARGGKFVYLPDMTVFLSYIKNCTYLITDSFHGTAFALNFNKQFIEILPNNKTGSRNQSILQLTGLTDRILQGEEDFSYIKNHINYDKVNSILSLERAKSFAILKSLIDNL